MKRKAPWYLYIPAIAVSLGVATPLCYLLIRGSDAQADELYALLWRWNNVELLWNTLLLTFAVLAITTLIGLPAAWLTSVSNIAFKKVWAVLLVLPLAIPNYLMAYVMLGIGGPKGAFYEMTGIGLLQLDPFWMALLALSLYFYPFMFLNLRSSILRMDRSQIEASRSLGVSGCQLTRQVIIPQLIPGFLAGALIICLAVIGDFGVVSLTRYRTISFVLYQQYEAQSVNALAYASWLALSLVVMSVGFLGVDGYLMRKMHQTVSARSLRRHVLKKLKGWQIPGQLFLLAIFTMAFVIPIASIIQWTRYLHAKWELSEKELVASVWYMPTIFWLVVLPLAAVMGIWCYKSWLWRHSDERPLLMRKGISGAVMVAFSLAVANWAYVVFFVKPREFIERNWWEATEPMNNFNDLHDAVINSIYVALPSTLVATLLALPVAALATRYKSKRANLAVRMSYMGYAVPCLAFGLGVVFFVLHFVDGALGWLNSIWSGFPASIYQTLPVLIVALALHYIAEAMGPLRASMFKATRRLEEAAQSLGRSRWESFWLVTFPLIRPGLIVSLSLVFIAAMKELPLNWLLKPRDFETLAHLVWSQADEAAFPEAAPPALLIIYLSAIFLALLLYQRRKAE